MTNTAAPTPARYEPRKLTDGPDAGSYSVWDSYIQSFVFGEGPMSGAAAIAACARINRAYRESWA